MQTRRTVVGVARSRKSSSAHGSQAYGLCFRHCVLSVEIERVVSRLAKDTGIKVDVESSERQIGSLKVQFELESLGEEDFHHPFWGRLEYRIADCSLVSRRIG